MAEGFKGVLLSGYEVFGDKASGKNVWSPMSSNYKVVADAYSVALKIGIISTALALLFAALALIVYAGDAKRVGEEKKHILRVLIVGVCIAGSTGIMSLIAHIAF